MRIVAGRLKGRRLTPPKNDRLRPTSDRTRETLFNMLTHGLDFDLDGARVADLFAGTGALGIEALSRGATQAAFVDNHPDSLAIIKANLAALGLLQEAIIIKSDARRLPPAPSSLDLVFLDPPYGKDLVPPALHSLYEGGWLRTGALVVIETAAAEELEMPAWLMVEKMREIGDTRLLICRVENLPQ